MDDLLVFLIEVTAFAALLFVGGLVADYVLPWLEDDRP